MNAEEALTHCQAYLDRELDPATVARIDACLAENPRVAEAYAREREFHAFLKARSARVNAPKNLAAGIQVRLDKARRPDNRLARATQSRRFWGGNWLLAVAGVALAATIILIAA